MEQLYNTGHIGVDNKDVMPVITPFTFIKEGYFCIVYHRTVQTTIFVTIIVKHFNGRNEKELTESTKGELILE